MSSDYDDFSGIFSESESSNKEEAEIDKILITDFDSKPPEPLIEQKEEENKPRIENIKPKDEKTQLLSPPPVISIPIPTKTKNSFGFQTKTNVTPTKPNISPAKSNGTPTRADATSQSQSTFLLTSLKMPIIANLRKSIAKEVSYKQHSIESDDEKATEPTEKEIKDDKGIEEKPKEEMIDCEEEIIIKGDETDATISEENKEVKNGIKEENKEKNDKEEEEKKENISQTQEVPQIPITPKYSDAELQLLLDDVLNNKTAPPAEMHHPVLSYTKRVQYEAVIQEDYDKAEKLEEAVKFLEHNNESKQPIEEPVVTVDMRIQQTKQSIADVEEKYKNRLKSFENSKKLRLQELENTHQNEIEQLEEKISSPEFLHQFDKPSARLIQIRELQKMRAFQKDFIGAKQMKRIGDDLEKKETEEAKQNAISKIEKMYKHLLTKQNREVECAKQNWKRQKVAIELERDAELNPIKALLSQLERHGHHSLKYSIKQRCNSSAQPSYAPMTAVVTPRTRKRMNDFKKKGQGRLNLVGLDAAKYIKPNRPLSRHKTIRNPDF